MKKKLFTLIIMITLLLTTGCFKRDSMEGIEIMTTIYPIEYITTRLYGQHALINSIYPDGVDIHSEKISNKQINNASKKEMFIYNGLDGERDTASKLLEQNKKVKIIDSSFGMEHVYGEEELWLNPSHMLTMTQNVRDGLKEFISNNYLKKEIDENFEQMNVELSELDAELKLIAENSVSNTIVVTNKTLKFLEKYGFNVISLETDANTLDKNIAEVKKLINNKTVNYIITFDYEEQSEVLQNIIAETSVPTLTFKRINNLTEQERNNKDTYFTLMRSNLELLKQEVYQ